MLFLFTFSKCSAINLLEDENVNISKEMAGKTWGIWYLFGNINI
jgi:hypothetical protein